MKGTKHFSELLAFAVALVSATVGGAIFAWAHLPMPWLLGAITGTAVTVMSGRHARIPNTLRNLVLVVLGLMIGATLEPSILEDLPRWPVSLAGIAIYVVIATGSQYLFFKYIGRYDTPTAYFSAAPGGFMAMTVIGKDFGGTERLIALTHSVRIVTVVFALVLGLELFTGHGTGGNHSGYVPLHDITLFGWALLIAAGVLGVLLSRILHLPGAAIIGPMIVMAIIQGSGLAAAKVPSGPILVAEVILGSSIGAQFAGSTFSEVRRGVLLSIASTLTLLGMSLGFAMAVHAITGLNVLALLLAYSPGGMSGISLIALALSMQPAFVAIHNMLRMLLILIFGPITFRFLQRR